MWLERVSLAPVCVTALGVSVGVAGAAEVVKVSLAISFASAQVLAEYAL